eukprot:TRINITY_DN5073_c0_g1_i2.p1 TRINITY_DN5073_c0_g1~~TRINITY_DN5073_c0_g1_i2.p1  ORF type:complete len:308 (+),score=85.90 TRINITY_DN5073_c0_g1_i2:152-1075(+)
MAALNANPTANPVYMMQVPMQMPMPAPGAPMMYMQMMPTGGLMQMPMGLQGQGMPGVSVAAAPPAAQPPAGFLPVMMQPASASAPVGGSAAPAEGGEGADAGNAGKPMLMRASAATSFQKLAGALAKRLRQDGVVEIEAMGPAAQAQAFRAMVLAKSFLCEDLTSFDVEVFCIEGSDSAHVSLRFAVKRKASMDDVSVAGAPVVNVDAGAGKTAGVLAWCARSEPGVVRHLICGPCASSMNTAAKALARARRMLVADHLGLKMQPIAAVDLNASFSFALIPYSLRQGALGGAHPTDVRTKRPKVPLV